MRPSVRQLEYAVAVADARHFGRAARACAVTQPALSAQIQALEAELGVALFERSRRGVQLTPAGTRIIERARAALRGLDEVTDAARGAAEPLCGPLHLGVIPTLAPYVLPRWLPVVRRKHPRLQLFLHEDQTARLVQRLHAGELELLLLALPVEGSSIDVLPLFDEPFLLAVPAGHRLAGDRKHRVRESELARERVLLLEDGHCLRDQALSVCRHAGAHESEQVRAASLTTLVQMVANGLGVTLLPESAVAVETRGARDLAVLAFRPPAPGRRIGLAWRRGSPRSAEFHLLGALVPGRDPALQAAAPDAKARSPRQ